MSSNSSKMKNEKTEETNKPKVSVIDLLEHKDEDHVFHNEVKTHHGKDLFRSKSEEHYYVLSDNRKRVIRCISCKILHGGILEAHLLTRYKINDGVLSLDGKAVNKIPQGFLCPDEWKNKGL